MCETGKFHNLVAILRLNPGCISPAEDRWLAGCSKSCRPLLASFSDSGCWVPASSQGSDSDDGGGGGWLGWVILRRWGKRRCVLFCTSRSLGTAVREWQWALGSVGSSSVRNGREKCREQFIYKPNDKSSVSFKALELSKIYSFLKKPHYEASLLSAHRFMDLANVDDGQADLLGLLSAPAGQTAVSAWNHDYQK